jgi:hypothetical protein
MKNYPDFWSVLLGKGPTGFFLGYCVVAIICALALMFVELKTRNVDSKRSPEKFNLKFWLLDNVARFIGNPLLIFIAIRACYEYVPPVGMLFVSMGIGFGSDGLGILFKRMGVLTTNKLAERVTEKINEKENKA